MKSNTVSNIEKFSSLLWTNSIYSKKNWEWEEFW